MTTRSIEFRWLPFDGDQILAEPGKHGIIYNGPQESSQMAVLIAIDLAGSNRKLDPEDILVLVERVEYVQAGKPWPAHLMDGVDGYVFFSAGVVLIGSGANEESMLLIDPDEFTRVLRAVHKVFAGPDFHNQEAKFDDITFEVLFDGPDTLEEYKRRGGETTAWNFDPKKCTFTYEGQPEHFEYPHPISPGFQELCE